jgi:hypothetical protein
MNLGAGEEWLKIRNGKKYKTKTKFKARESANQELRYHLRSRAVVEEVGMEN